MIEKSILHLLNRRSVENSAIVMEDGKTILLECCVSGIAHFEYNGRSSETFTPREGRPSIVEPSPVEMIYVEIWLIALSAQLLVDPPQLVSSLLLVDVLRQVYLHL